MPTSSDRKYWLLKTEPTTFSFDDLWKAPKRTTSWDGVRNFQARNMLRDQMKEGDLVFIYHSSTDPTGIAGIAEVGMRRLGEAMQAEMEEVRQQLLPGSLRHGPNRGNVLRLAAKSSK